jgi:hypothetical protein
VSGVHVRRRVAPQLVGGDLVRHFGTRRQHAFERPLGRRLVATRLQQHIEFIAVLIDCSPQQIRFAAQHHEHFVQNAKRYSAFGEPI